MDPVVHAMNSMRARWLKHKQFRSFLEDIEADFTDVLYHTNVCWLSMEKVLKRVWDLKAEIVMFFSMKDILWLFKGNGEWRMGLWFCICCGPQNYKAKVYFLMNCTCKWKPFNRNLNFLPSSWMSKTLFIFLLKTRAVTSIITQVPVPSWCFKRGIYQVCWFQGNWRTVRFAQLTFCLWHWNSYWRTEDGTDWFASRQLFKRMFESKPRVEFYSSLHSEKFQNLKKIARKMFVLFASTYICEQTFSIMKVNKSKTRSLLTDSNLQSVLRISTSNLTPNFNTLVNDCSQMHHSHWHCSLTYWVTLLFK